MPWTFAHPAAVLPLRRFCPARLNFAALMLGTLAPDLGYHIDAWALATYAHTAAGSFVVCTPTGLALLAICYAVRRPICHLLPQPHRGALEPLVAVPIPTLSGDLLVASASVLIGAWTHIAWDSFTHEGGWVVDRWAVLRKTIHLAGNHDVEVFSLLQHSSTVLGVAILVAVYCSWLRRLAGSVFRFEREDRWRYALLAAVSLIALLMATVLSTKAVLWTRGDPDVESFAFYMAVYGVCFFIPMLIVAALLCYPRTRQS